ncbi:MAG: IS1 family transposase [Bacteroidota bacterium]
MKCQYCKGNCIKKGCYKKQQLYQCKNCSKYQRTIYKKIKIDACKLDLLKQLNEEGNSTSSISRILKISKSSVQRKVRLLAGLVKRPESKEQHQRYEVDELKTYVGNSKNECWIIYAISRETGRIIDFAVGRRTKKNVKRVIDSLLKLNPGKIYTDYLNMYANLIGRKIHVASKYMINHIERKNLDLRKDIKCLNRKTICYSKSKSMLEAKLKLYFWT